ncbi:hypothetical protein BKA65DRAFT_382842, partial [Rhexocercosporidium sp. MPI-PUGE-AT-0058]
TQRERTDVNCLQATGQPWKPASLNTVKIAVDALWSSKKYCSVKASHCERIGCVDHAAVYFCNNNKKSISQGCPYLAQYARAIMDKCQTTNGNGGVEVAGQAWDKENWNVFI